MTRLLLVLVAVTAVSCVESQSTSVQVARISPFNALVGVALGMKAERLQTVRPQATFEAYTGFVEQLNGSEIRYRFTQTAAGSLEAGSQLSNVWSIQTTPDSTEGDSRWRALAGATAKELGEQRECFRTEYALAFVQAEEWTTGTARVVVEFSTPKPLQRLETTSRISIAVGDLAWRPPFAGTRIPQPCS